MQSWVFFCQKKIHDSEAEIKISVTTSKWYKWLSLDWELMKMNDGW